jgi:hypothetical protein
MTKLIITYYLWILICWFLTDQNRWLAYQHGIRSKRFQPKYEIPSCRPPIKFFSEQISYFAAAEDGFASAYLTPFDSSISESLGQRAIESDDGTAFTLSSINYNRLDAKVYAMVTYQSGAHALVRVSHARLSRIEKNIWVEVERFPKLVRALRIDCHILTPALYRVGARGYRAADQPGRRRTLYLLRNCPGQ